MRLLLYIGILLCGFSCTRNAPCLHPGDLLFQVGETSEMTGAITAATGKERQLNYSHVGIAVRSRGVDSVLEATSDGGVRVTLRPNRRTACGYGNASARHDGRRSSDRAGAKIHRTALRLLVPTGQRQDVLQRPGMGKLPRPGRQQTISGPADEFPRGRRIVTPVLGRTVCRIGRGDSPGYSRNESQRHGTRSATQRGRPLLLTWLSPKGLPDKGSQPAWLRKDCGKQDGSGGNSGRITLRAGRTIFHGRSDMAGPTIFRLLSIVARDLFIR